MWFFTINDFNKHLEYKISKIERMSNTQIKLVLVQNMAQFKGNTR